MKLHQDVQEVSLLAMVHFLIIWPIMCVVVYRVKRQGKSMTYYRAIQIISSVLIILMAIVFGCLYQYVVKPNAYQVLQVSRFDSEYKRAKAYNKLRTLYKQGGVMTEEDFHHIEQAYDVMYETNRRTLYDSWGDYSQVFASGPKTGTVEANIRDCVHVGVFYLVWAVAVYSLTYPLESRRARSWTSTLLILIFGFDFAVRFVYYDPAISLLPQTTPYELLILAQRCFPFFVWYCYAYERIFYVDIMKHRQSLLKHLMKNDTTIKKSLQSIYDMLSDLKQED